MPSPISPRRLAANRANAARSTGPRTLEGKARSSQNARKYSFNPENFAVVRIETPELVANLRADAVAAYQPANSQELFAVERIVLAQVSLLRAAALEAGMFTNCLEEAMESPGRPLIFQNPDLTKDLEVALGQNRAYWAATGFRRVIRMHPLAIQFVLRYVAQAERLYRRAVEDYDRLKALRPELSSQEPSNEPENNLRNEPNADPQPQQNKPPAPSASSHSEPTAPTAATRSGAPPASDPAGREIRQMPDPPCLVNG